MKFVRDGFFGCLILCTYLATYLLNRYILGERFAIWPFGSYDDRLKSIIYIILRLSVVNVSFIQEYVQFLVPLAV